MATYPAVTPLPDEWPAQAPSTQQNYQFDKDTATRYLGQASPSSPRVYVASISDKWLIGDSSGGAFLLALSTGAVMDSFADRHQKHPISVNIFYLNKAPAGPCVIEVTDLKTTSNGYAVAQVTLKQVHDVSLETPPPATLAEYNPDDYKTRAHSIFNMGNMLAELGITYTNQETTVEPPKLENMVSKKPPFFETRLIQKLDKTMKVARRDKASKIETPGETEWRHVIEFKDGRPMDFKATAAMADTAIPTAWNLGNDKLGGPCWTPTLHIEVQFRRIPSGKVHVGKFVTTHIINGRLSVDAWLFNEHGELLAIARHHNVIIPWSIWAKNSNKL